MTRSGCSIARLIVAGVLGVAACTDKASDAKDAAATTSDSAKPGMAGMNMPGMMSAATMDSIQAHMRSMAALSADQMAAMLPSHRSMVANALSQMSADMRAMNMTADPQWTALADSIRQDLVRLPEMTKPEVAQAMPAHHQRVTRLLNMHKEMMGKMK